MGIGLVHGGCSARLCFFVVGNWVCAWHARLRGNNCEDFTRKKFDGGQADEGPTLSVQVPHIRCVLHKDGPALRLGGHCDGGRVADIFTN